MVSGFSFLYPMLMSITIFAGSIEFITVNMLLGAFDPLQGICHDADDQCEASVLRDLHAG